MNQPTRQRLLEHLLKISEQKPVEQQLREQWLAELARIKLSNSDSATIALSKQVR